MTASFAKAAYIYPDVAGDVGGMLAKCNEMGGEAAQKVGYGMAYVFSKGMVQVRVVVGGWRWVGRGGLSVGWHCYCKCS
jgi:hypothetical protein